MDKKMKKAMGNVVLKTLYKQAEKSANSTCPFIHGQPEMPDSVKALKKRGKKILQEKLKYLIYLLLPFI